MRKDIVRRRRLVVKTLKGMMRQAVGGCRGIEDGRVVRRLNWLVLAIILAGTVRLNGLVQQVAYGQAGCVQAAENALSIFLMQTDYPAHRLFARFRDDALEKLPRRARLSYRGKPH